MTSVSETCAPVAWVLDCRYLDSKGNPQIGKLYVEATDLNEAANVGLRDAWEAGLRSPAIVGGSRERVEVVVLA